jgi:hypothetical protein
LIKEAHRKRTGGVGLNPATYIPIIFLWIIVIWTIYSQRQSLIVKKLIEKRKREGNKEMKELALRFLEKDCVIYAFNNQQFEGVIKEVTDGAILIEKNEKLEAINLDFVVRIREYPKNKKGKKVSVVID